MKKQKLTLESDLILEQMYLKFNQEELQINCEHEEKMTARAREHEIWMTEIYLRAISANTNQGNHLLPLPANMHSITTPMQRNTMAATIFSRSFAAPFSTASTSSPILYEKHHNETSVSNSYLGSNDAYHGFNSPN